jgi:hypothetical protein
MIQEGRPQLSKSFTRALQELLGEVFRWGKNEFPQRRDSIFASQLN